MKKLLFIVGLFLSLIANSQSQTSYTVATLSAMKSYFGNANKIYVKSTNEDYILCTSGCPTTDELTIFAGSGGRKWIKLSDYKKLDNIVERAPIAMLSGGNTSGIDEEFIDDILHIQKTSLDSIDITLLWTAARQSRSDSIKTVLVDNISQSFVQPTVGNGYDSVYNVTIQANVNTDKSIIVTTKDNLNNTKTISVKFENKWFYGFSTNSAFSSTVLQGLHSFFSQSLIADGRQIDLGNINGRQYAIIAFDETLDPDNLIKIESEGFDQTAKFTRTIQSFTNENGYTTNYIVYVGNTTSGSTFSVNFKSGGTIVYTQESLKQGVNQPESEPVVKMMWQNTSKWSIYDTFFLNYNCNYWRFPGGTISRYVNWDDSIPSNGIQRMAGNRLADYYDSLNIPEKADEFRDKNNVTYGNEYRDYLNFCVATHSKPVVQVNTVLYIQGDTVYPVEPFKKGNGTLSVDMGVRADRWDTITANIIRQIQYTHDIIGEDSVCYWELGNENYSIYPALTYAEICVKYTNIIKSFYPRDRVLWSISKGNLVSEKKEQWNIDVINYFQESHMLNKMDYVVAHFAYPKAVFSELSQDSINARVQDDYFLNDCMKLLKSYFPQSNTPKFWLTEVSSAPITTNDTNFNKQLGALTSYDMLLKLHAEKYVAGYNRHTGVGDKNGMYFDSSIFGSENLTYLDPDIHTTEAFWYISPSGWAYKLFKDTLGDETISYVINANYEALVTSDGSSTIIKVLNYNSTSKSFGMTSYTGTKTYVSYQLDDLTAYYWTPYAHKTSGSATTTVTLPSHSFTTIVITP